MKSPFSFNNSILTFSKVSAILKLENADPLHTLFFATK